MERLFAFRFRCHIPVRVCDRMPDIPPLVEFARTGSADAFAEIVRGQVDLVFSVARRMVHDPHLAEDVMQATFIVLARKAGKVRPGTLSGWLVNTTRLAAKDAIRSK